MPIAAITFRSSGTGSRIGAEYDAAFRQRGSLTVWFTNAAIAAWRAEPRATPGGQPSYSALAIATALTLRAVFHLALRQTEGLIGSIIRLLGLDLGIPDHSTLTRRAETLQVPSRTRSGTEPVHLLVDSTGLKLCGAGEWLVERRGTRTRRSWRKLHLGTNADTGEIVAAELTTNDVDDGSQVRPLLNRAAGPVASFTGDGAYDRDDVYGAVAERYPDAAVIVPLRSRAAVETAPTQRDKHLRVVAERGRMGWQRPLATIVGIGGGCDRPLQTGDLTTSIAFIGTIFHPIGCRRPVAVLNDRWVVLPVPLTATLVNLGNATTIESVRSSADGYTVKFIAAEHGFRAGGTAAGGLNAVFPRRLHPLQLRPERVIIGMFKYRPSRNIGRLGMTVGVHSTPGL
jgi:hypothetical protein